MYKLSEAATEVVEQATKTTKTTKTRIAEQLRITDLLLKYDAKPVIQGLNLALAEGEISCLLGPSGCGKSTLLRAIAGFEPVHHGEINMQGQTISSPKQQVPPERRNIGMVFQDVALFPHLSVSQNIAYGLSGLSDAQKSLRVAELLDLVGLPDFEQRYPASLSGGQQQRIALARALAPNPKLLLLDEPFSGLDAALSETLMLDVRRILVEQRITALVVTHDQAEAFTLADRIAVMNGGRIEQWDIPANIYHSPKTRFVADFIGQGQFVSGSVTNSGEVKPDFADVGVRSVQTLEAGAQVEILIRPDDLVVDSASSIRAIVVSKQFRGPGFAYLFQFENGERLLCAASSSHVIGEHVGVRLKLKDVIFFPRQ